MSLRLRCEVAHKTGLNTVTAARELSQRGQDLGMMEQRLLIFAKKEKGAPALKKEDTAVNHMALSKGGSPVKLNEMIENFRQSILTETDSEISSDLLKKLNERGSLLDDSVALRAPSPDRSANLFATTGAPEGSIVHPSSYHLLPPPPFPNGQLAVILGDTSLSCREKLNGVWNVEDFETRKKLVKALMDCGYAADQVFLNQWQYFVFLIRLDFYSGISP